MSTQAMMVIALCLTSAFLGLEGIARADDPDLVVSAPTKAPYVIKGSTAAELRAQMNLLGPFSAKEKRRFDAKTDSKPFAEFTLVRKKGKSCNIKTVKVTITTKFIVPEWTPPADVDPALVKKWNTFLANLQIHENGHQQLAIDAGKDLLAKIKNLPGARSCEALNKDAQAIQPKAQAMLEKNMEKYDTDTRHGETQGAKFP
jgi:predicted secreted Zn-dependent protease